jgi:hypothetical protein
MTSRQPRNGEAAFSLTVAIPLWRGCIPRHFFADPGQSAHGQIQAGTESLLSGVFSLITQLTGDHAKEVVLIKRWLPLMLLIVFTAISMAALSAMAKHMAQKRTIFGDPLCKIIWKKTYPVGRNASPARKPKNRSISRSV